MQNTISTQHQLNQPFEFQEVLLSPREKAKLQQRFSSGQLFGGGDASVFTEFKTRELSIRLRTINNAHDTLFTLPDGTPVTEVSIYGSRERQYLATPYSAVKRLMKGEMPQGGAIKNAIVKDGMTISNLHSKLEDVLAQLGDEGQIGQRIFDPGFLRSFLSISQFEAWDAQLTQAFMCYLPGFQDKIDAVLRGIDASCWWWPWTEPYKGQAAEVMDRFSEVQFMFARLSRDIGSIYHVHAQLAGVLEQLGSRGGVIQLTLEQRPQQIQRSDIPVVDRFMAKLAGFNDEMRTLIPRIDASNAKVPLTGQLDGINGPAAEIMNRYEEAMKTFLVDLYPELNRA